MGANTLTIGTGTIGEPFTNLLAEQQNAIGLENVLFHKRTPLLDERGKVRDMIARGAHLVVDKDKVGAFKELGLEPAMTLDEAYQAVDVVIDCTPAGNKLKERDYKNLKRPKGFIAQGSEEGFGIPYVWRLNDHVLRPGADKFIQVVSCNTHNMCRTVDCAVLQTVGIENLERAAFFIARRDSDVSEDKGIHGVEVGRVSPKYKPYGTHHAYDGARVLKTFLSIDPPLYSMALKVSSQYMHVACFYLHYKQPVSLENIRETFHSNPLVATTYRKSTNKVFARARDAGKPGGRIYNQIVLCEDTLDISPDGKYVSGVTFTPQDSNAILSSVAATLWLIDPATHDEKMQVFNPFLSTEI